MRGLTLTLILPILVSSLSRSLSGEETTEPAPAREELLWFTLLERLIESPPPARAERDRPLLGSLPASTAPRGPSARLDVTPILEQCAARLREMGLPLEPDGEVLRKGRIGVAAAFTLREDLPQLVFRTGERAADVDRSFYSNAKGFSWELTWPVHEQWTLRLEGAKAGRQFGYHGIAGVQWRAPRGRLSAGIGMPILLRNADGEIGLIGVIRIPFR